MWVLILWLSGLENQKRVYQLYLCAQIVIFTPLWVDGHGKTMFFCDWLAVTWHYFPSHWTIMKQYTLKVEQSKMLKKPVLHATKFWTHDGVQHEKSQSVRIHCGMWRVTSDASARGKTKTSPVNVKHTDPHFVSGEWNSRQDNNMNCYGGIQHWRAVYARRGIRATALSPFQFRWKNSPLQFRWKHSPFQYKWKISFLCMMIT